MRAAGSHLSERFRHGAGDIPGPERLPPPLGDRAHDAGLVEDFVYSPKVLADLASGDLTGNQEHGRRAGVRGGHAGFP